MGLFELAGHDRTKRAIDRAAQQQLQLAANQQGTVASLQERVRKLEEHARQVHDYESREVSRYADLKRRVELMEADVAALPHPEVLLAVQGEIEANARRLAVAEGAIDTLYANQRDQDGEIDELWQLVNPEHKVEPKGDPFPQFPPVIIMDDIPEQERVMVLNLIEQDEDLRAAGYKLVVEEPSRWRILPDDDAMAGSPPPDLPTEFLKQAEWLIDHVGDTYETDWDELARVWKERLKFLRQAMDRGAGGVWKDVDLVIKLQERINELEAQADAPSQEA